MEKENLKIIVAGHLDHGKSTLIGRLIIDLDSLSPEKMKELEIISKKSNKDLEPAFLIDYLQEEREQGITIETSQAFLQTQKKNYCLIDVPGHIEFIKNMITGATHAGAAILIIDITKGIEEQTKKHAYILKTLGINQAIVLINKMDIVRYRQKAFEQIKEEVRNSLHLTPSHIIPVSALNGENITVFSQKMKWYDGKILTDAIDSLDTGQRCSNNSLIFPVQDIYELDGEKIILGRVESGILKKNQHVNILPSNQKTAIKSIKVFNRDRTEAKTGECIEVTLKDSSDIHRGQIICDESAPAPTVNLFKSNIFYMHRTPLKKNEKLILRCATQEVECSLSKIEKRVDWDTLEIDEEDASQINRNETALVSITTETPVVVTDYYNIKELGRFVLERDREPIAGGIIIHNLKV